MISIMGVSCVTRIADELNLNITSNSYQCVLFINPTKKCAYTANNNNLGQYSNEFTHIIEYECNELLEHQNQCVNCNLIEHLWYGKHEIKLKFELESNLIPEYIQFSNKQIIVSTALIERNKSLIELFERKLKIIVFERDYENLMQEYKINIEYADIIVNETTGMIIIDEIDRNNDVECCYMRLKSRIECLIHQFNNLYLIYKFKNENINEKKASNYNNQTKSNSLKLIANLVAFTSKIDCMKTKLLTVNNINEFQNVFSNILSDFNDTFELSISANMSEIILLSFHCFNSFSAQSVLNKYSLKQLFNSNINSIQSKNDDDLVPFRVIDIFYKILNHSTTDAKKSNGYVHHDDNIQTNYTNSLHQSQYKLTYEKSNKFNSQTNIVFKKY